MALKYLYVPSGYKAGKAYGVLPNEANADLAFVRGSSATRINADGLIETMGNNVPRLDYTDGSCPTLLAEPESRNLVEYSEDFSQWLTTVSGTGVAPVISTGFSAPDGSSNARKIVFDKGSGSTSSDICFIKDSYTSEVDVFTQTVWMRTESGTANVLMDFNSANSNEVVVTTTWQRMTLTKSATFTTDKEFRIGLRGGSSTVDSATILVWGAQLEKQSYATSYIYNNGTALGVTRSADTGIVTSDLSSYVNSTEGVLEVKISRFEGIPSTEQSWISLSASETNDDNSVSIGFTGLNTTLAHFIKSSDVYVAQPTTSQVTEDLSQMNVIKLKWKNGDFQAKIGNTTIDLSAGAGSLPFASTLKYLRIGYPSYSGGDFKGNIQYIKVYDSATDF